MKIQKLEQLRELIKEGWKLDQREAEEWWGEWTSTGTSATILENNDYRLKSPSGDIIPVEYCKGDLDEHSLNVGDRVRCKPGYINNPLSDSDPTRGGGGYFKGREFIIEKMSNRYAWGEDNNLGVSVRALKLIPKPKKVSRKLQVGDTVEVIAGDQKGTTGRVLRVIPAKKSVVVQGCNIVKKHVRPSRKNPQGGRINIERPIHLSNVLPVNPKSSKGSRVHYQLDKDGSKKRVATDGSEISVVRKAK